MQIMNADKIPDIIIGRLPIYLRALINSYLLKAFTKIVNTCCQHHILIL